MTNSDTYQNKVQGEGWWLLKLCVFCLRGTFNDTRSKQQRSDVKSWRQLRTFEDARSKALALGYYHTFMERDDMNIAI